MKKTFSRRVAAERQVLNCINKIFSPKNELAGLSSTAIERWKFSSERPINTIALNTIHDLARVCGSFSDRSMETFNEDITRPEEEFERLLENLRFSIIK